MSDFQQNTEAFEVWGFPSLDSYEMPVMPVEVIEPSDSGSPSELLPQLTALQGKIQYLDDIALQIKTMLADVDVTLLSNVSMLIKEVVKKIILRELHVDDNLFRDMIKQSLAIFNKEDEACILYVAADDYFIFEQQGSPVQHMTVLVDPALEKGDFSIKTKLSELQAILDDRLTVLFKI